MFIKGISTLIKIIFLSYCTSIWIKDSRHFIDEHGRVTIFHGVNVVYKAPPYIPILDKFDPFFSLNEDDVQYMIKYGFNLVRLGVIWEAVEKKPGVYDYEYLEKTEYIINMLGKAGIYTLVDAHQDMFSRIFCGEGVPIFYAKELYHETECKSNILSRVLRLLGACLPLKTFNWRYDDQGIPLIDDCKTGFLKFHQSPELTTIYNSFYRNENQIQDKFVAFWKVVADKFKTNPYIIGYDLWNEPWPGNLWSDVKSMWPGYSDHYQVLPFYRKLDEGIRTVHQDYISFFESIPFPDTLPLFGGKVVGEFIETPAQEPHKNKQVLNLHSYCCQARADVCETGEPLLKDALTLCKKFHKSKLKANLKNAEKLKVPLIITEFGACSNSEACYYEMEGFVQAAEEHIASWAYWNYKPYGDHTTTAAEHTEGIFLDDGKPQETKIKALTRPYIQAYQGIPISSKFDLDSSTYTSRFIFDPSIEAPSILYFNSDFFYPDGYDLKISGENITYTIYQLPNQTNYIYFKIDKNVAPNNPIIEIKLSTK